MNEHHHLQARIDRINKITANVAVCVIAFTVIVAAVLSAVTVR